MDRSSTGHENGAANGVAENQNGQKVPVCPIGEPKPQNAPSNSENGEGPANGSSSSDLPGKVVNQNPAVVVAASELHVNRAQTNKNPVVLETKPNNDTGSKLRLSGHVTRSKTGTRKKTKRVSAQNDDFPTFFINHLRNHEF